MVDSLGGGTNHTLDHHKQAIPYTNHLPFQTQNQLLLIPKIQNINIHPPFLTKTSITAGARLRKKYADINHQLCATRRDLRVAPTSILEQQKSLQD